MTPERRARISAALKGRKVGPRKSPGLMPCTEARRQAIIEGKKRAKERWLIEHPGEPYPSHRPGPKGPYKKLSEETQQRMSEGQKRRHAKLREEAAVG